MNLRAILLLAFISAEIVNATASFGQEKGSVDLRPLPPLAHPNDPKIGAKELFGRKVLPAAMPSRVIGFYAKGCIAGAEALPINGDTWQVMRHVFHNNLPIHDHDFFSPLCIRVVTFARQGFSIGYCGSRVSSNGF